MERIADEGMRSVEYCTMFRPKSHGKRNTRVYAMSCNEVYNYVGYHEKTVMYVTCIIVLLYARKGKWYITKKNNRQGFLCLDFEVKYWWGGEYTCVLH